MKKSINAWSIDSKTDFEKMFSELSEAGFDAVELNVDAADTSAHSLTMTTNTDELKAVQKLSKQYNLPVVSISSSLYGGKMGARCKEDRLFTQALLKKQLQCAEALGAKGILIVPGGSAPKIPHTEDFETSLQTLAELRDIIEKTEIYVGVENVWNGFFTSPYDMVRFIDRLDCQYIGAYFDVGNMVAFSWPEYWAEVLGRRIHNVHIKDFKRRGGINRGGEFVDLLKGDINWQAVVPALSKAGFDGCLTAEVDKSDPKMSYMDFYRETAQAIDKIIHIAQ